jgi:hypothetical protein
VTPSSRSPAEGVATEKPAGVGTVRPYVGLVPADPDPDLVVPDAATIVGLLADDERRRVIAALVLGSSTIDEVRHATGLSVRSVATALQRLVDGGLVEQVKGNDHVLLASAFRRAAVAAKSRRSSPKSGGDVPDDARILHTYLRDGRLTRIPAHRAKRLVVLDRLAQDFELGAHYTEAQVNAILRAYHDDVAALRRYLVDEGFLDRTPNDYWRSGGTTT